MVKSNKGKKLLDRKRNKLKRFELKEVDKPNLYKDIFPYY